uniref:Uncharacterized protein n=1 Tax=Gossypium raimondii TaxID=29730 RepID=A0A0D2SVI5_GOSRA|nr:hypothetical protein B456_010G189200 [Gossypium raimondii]KJB67403.1 hypothetical protein B456_010G189200 [Gossypium raimondii]
MDEIPQREMTKEVLQQRYIQIEMENSEEIEFVVSKLMIPRKEFWVSYSGITKTKGQCHNTQNNFKGRQKHLSVLRNQPFDIVIPKIISNEVVKHTGTSRYPNSNIAIPLLDSVENPFWVS